MTAQGATMVIWQYDKIDLNGTRQREDDVDMLNYVGKQGWELVHITNNSIAYLKRAIPNQASTKVTSTKATKRARVAA